MASGDALPEGLLISGPHTLDVTTGTSFDLMLSVANFGSTPVEGALIWAQGSALDQRLVRLVDAKAIALAITSSGFDQIVVPFEQAPPDVPGSGAMLEDLRLGAMPTLATSEAAYMSMFQAQAGVFVTGQALSRGSGVLVFAALPLAATQAGAGSDAQALEIIVAVG